MPAQSSAKRLAVVAGVTSSVSLRGEPWQNLTDPSPVMSTTTLNGTAATNASEPAECSEGGTGRRADRHCVTHPAIPAEIRLAING
jgi:hypothetical protein